MKKKEIVLTLGLLAEKRACKLGIKEFKKWYPSGSATLTEVLRKLQELASTSADYDEYEIYIEYAKWLLLRFPSTQEPLVLNKLTEKVIIHNGDIDIYSDVDGEYTIICNGNLNIKGNGNLNGHTGIWAKKEVKAINIAAYAHSGIWAMETIKAINIETKDYAGIWAEKINTINITAKGLVGIWAEKINTQNIMDGDRTRIHGDINLIQHSYN